MRIRGYQRQLVQQRPTLTFWLGFLALSALLFLPLYLFNRENSTLLPAGESLRAGLRVALNRLLLWRENLDPFRLSLELTVAVALWSVLRPLRHAVVRGVIIGIYLAALGYALYEALIVSIYHADPVFYSQYFLARDGLPFLARHLQTSGWTYLAVGGGLATAVLVIVAVVNLLLDSAAEARLQPAARWSMVGLAGLCLVVAVRYQHYTARPEMVVSSLFFKLQQNIAASRQLHDDIVRFDDKLAQSAYDYTDYRLVQKPDLYLIFVESYGSVLYQRTHFRASYIHLLDDLEDQLAAARWQSASALSESPTWGGGSWMAYTSLLFGLRIDSHPQYLSLLNKYQVQHYPNLGRYLQSQGYYYAWVSSIADELDDAMWAKYIRFLGVDEWLRYRDLDYRGPRYGWGPAPPDQYTLNYASELLQKTTDQPLLFVTLTQNSHFPWTPQPQLAQDWRTLSDGATITAAPAAAGETTNIRQDYLQAIHYQLQMLTQFVIEHGDENSLFVLIGDHQPPQVSRRADGWATPIHIISQDRLLIKRFADYGFTPGLRVRTLEPSLRHEGFYSLLMRVLLGNEEAESIVLPSYLPKGVTFAAADEPAAQ